jgi:ribosomal protein S18 acetylase RimI-like enzyme
MRVSGAMFAVAALRNRIVGIGHALPARERDGDGSVIPGLVHLSMVAVEPEYWGKGLGKAIVRHFLVRAKQSGFETIQLWTHPTNERAQGLYAGIGFREAGRDKIDERGELIRLYRMQLDRLDGAQ